MELWPKSWTCPWNRSRSPQCWRTSTCPDVLADDAAWCQQAGPPQPASAPGGSAFHEAMHGAGVLVMAADSRVIWPELHLSFGDLLNATRWTPWNDPKSPPLLSLSYVSARVPNVFCAQPHFDASGCGAHDVLLLFRNSPSLWRRACAVSLNDACGIGLCRLSSSTRRRRRCPHASEPQRAAALCEAVGGGAAGAGRCLAESSAALEGAMQALQSACRSADANASASFAHQPTCWGRNRGALHNELQFRAPIAGRIGAALEAALVAVGTIAVAAPSAHVGASASDALAAASAARLCRARRLAAALRTALRLPRPEVWRFSIEPSLTPTAPLLYNAPEFCSRAHSCVGGGCHKRADYSIEESAASGGGDGRRPKRPKRTAPLLPRASNWGYYHESGKAWTQWSQFDL